MLNHILISITVFGLLIFGTSTDGTAQSYDQSKDTVNAQQDFFDRFQWVNSQQYSVHEIHAVGGYSFHSTRGVWGKIPGAKLQIWGLRYNRKFFLYNDSHLIEYVAEFNLSVKYNLTSSEYDFNPDSFSGFGITPVGFQFNLNKKNRVQPFLKSSAGFMYFNEPFPDDRGSQLNFTLEMGGGLEFVIAQNISLTLGYKYHHMSNGQLGFINPGVDSNIFYSGITIF